MTQRERERRPDRLAELEAALRDAQAGLGGFLWLSNNLHNAASLRFREFFDAAIGDARKAYNEAARLLGTKPDTEDPR